MDDKKLFDKLNELTDALNRYGTEDISYIIIASHDDKVFCGERGNVDIIFGMLAHIILRTADYLETSPDRVIHYVIQNMLFVMGDNKEGDEDD